MNRIDLMITNRTIREYRPMSWLDRRRYSRSVDHALRYVCPRDQPFRTLMETLFWLAAGALAACTPVACVVLFVRWWLCA